MKSLLGHHVLSVDIFNRQMLLDLVQIASRLEPVAKREVRCNVLQGAVLANLFFEASTRTRMSFHTAFVRLGGSVTDTTGFTFSSISKGESIEDTASVIAGYADAVVMRHPDIGSVAEFAKGINIPVVNAGDGAGEHPSQALLDYYTIDKEFQRLDKKVDGMTIAMVGDLKHGRTIHSLCKLLSLFDNITFRFIAPEGLRIPHHLITLLQSRGHTVLECESLEVGLKDADVVYATRIQRERIKNSENIEGYSVQYRVNAEAIQRYATSETIIMHPLPRDSREGAYDLSTDLDQSEQLAIFRQADNGVTMRMAIFASILGVSSEMENYFYKNRCYRPDYYRVKDANFYRL